MPDRGLGRRAAAAVLAVLLSALGFVLAGPAVAAPSSRDLVALAVRQLSPLTPQITLGRPQPLTITIDVTNLTDDALTGITITGRRGAPFTSPSQLDAAIRKPSAPDDSAPTIATAKPVTVDLPPGDHATATFTTTTDVGADGSNICLCTPAGVYPLFFTATRDGTVIGTTQTYLPAFDVAPATTHVAWLWPLVDRPHRLLGDTAFTDDDLAVSVSGGRLDRALQTVDLLVAARPDIALTLVVDPELLDELAVMATGKYTVATTGSGTRGTQPGTGAGAAKDWLNRFRFLLDTDPHVELVFTPYADPDLAAVTRAGLPWSAAVPAAMQARLALLLGEHQPSGTLAWPVAGTMSGRTAGDLAGAGIDTAVLSTTSVPQSALPASGAALAVTSDRGSITALTTAADVSSAVSDAVSADGPGVAALPRLMAELAVRVAQDNEAEHQVVLVPPRYVDADPTAAATAILQTTTAFWTASIDLQHASAPSDLGGVEASALTPRGGAALPADIVDRLRGVGRRLPGFTALLGGTTLPREVPIAVQRAESAAWTSDPGTGRSYADGIADTIDTIEQQVHLVTPNASSGTPSYTLASSSSKLPVTVQNDTDYTLVVRIEVTPVNQVFGFSAEPRTVTVEPRSKLATSVRTRVQRSGRIEVVARLYTTVGTPLGDPDGLHLSVHSTALGDIGLVITVVAGVALVLALARSYLKRYRRDPRPPGGRLVDQPTDQPADQAPSEHPGAPEVPV
ncbi:MAG: DUF6049 family protein [Jatrophihabitans sp.]|uniref:DUF6049 family protein n=1 Tax=Jatrophihabitans sp. TaxID=1932789 RepID=UPI003F7FD016